MTSRRLVFALALLISACGQAPGGGGADAGLDAGAGSADPLSEEIEANTERWESASSAYLDYTCACDSATCLGIDFWTPFSRCVVGVLGDNDEARREFAEVAGCYADGFAEVEQCIQSTTCETVDDDCREAWRCVYTSCDVGLSPTLRQVYEACHVLGAGIPGNGWRDVRDCL